MTKGAAVRKTRAQEKGRERPDLFMYQDYRAFLRDWVEHLKRERHGFSLRRLAGDAQMATGYLSMVLNGKHPLSAKALSKIVPHLGLGASERTFLELLRTVAESDNHAVRMDAIGRIQKFRSFGQHNPQELETFHYLSRWYHVAIREMSALKDLKWDPLEIQKRLNSRVTLKEIEDALTFLTAHGYIQLDKNGATNFPDKKIECFEQIYQVALRQFHREMFRISGEALDNTPIDKRHVLGHTVAVSPATYSQVRDLLEETLRKVGELTRNERKADVVYHVSLAAFPLTKVSEEKA